MTELDKKAHCRWIDHEGVRILEFDISGCSGKEATERQAAASRFLQSQPEHSVLCLTLAWGVRYDPRHTAEFARHMKSNDRFVIASAIVGLEHLTKLVNVLNRLSGRRVRAFDDVDEAKAWLVSNSASA